MQVLIKALTRVAESGHQARLSAWAKTQTPRSSLPNAGVQLVRLIDQQDVNPWRTAIEVNQPACLVLQRQLICKRSRGAKKKPSRNSKHAGILTQTQARMHIGQDFSLYH
jgi:hypothetical protein